MGKGRKERATPIRKDSAKVLRDWFAERSEPCHLDKSGAWIKASISARVR